MCNQCNRCNQVYLNSGSRGCGCNSCSSNQNSCGNNYEGCYGYDDNAFAEAQRIINHIERRRARENRCARQFVNCMRGINNNCNWD